MDIVEQATQIAVDAHRDQRRKTDDTPYVAHPLAVARILDKAGFSDVVVVAGIVHDVLEDTSVTEQELRNKLGDEIVDIVTAVSEDKNLEWEARKEQYVQQVANASEGTRAVSVADKIHNLKSLVDGYNTQGSAIWQKFNRGKEKKLWFEFLLLNTLKKTWQHSLLDEYEHLLNQVSAFEG